MAGLICAGDSDIGVAPEASLISIAYPQRTDNYSRLYLALRELALAVEGGSLALDLVNLSSGLAGLQPGRRLLLRHLLERLVRRGILVVAAVGNQHQAGEPPWCPAVFAEALAVGAANAQGQVCWFSRSGPCANPTHPAHHKPDLVAPGEDLLTCLRGGRHATVRGTSFATPIVSGVAALFLEQTPTLTAEDLRDALLASCIPLAEPPQRQGAGLIQAP